MGIVFKIIIPLMLLLLTYEIIMGVIYSSIMRMMYHNEEVYVNYKGESLRGLVLNAGVLKATVLIRDFDEVVIEDFYYTKLTLVKGRGINE